ncbi:MAG: precorrin-6y C5,15-methyltransferase (decarboxylating) subunit CbiE [Deltaproteobacteria bacterium]
MGARVTIIGCGPGGVDLMTIRAKSAIEEADLIVGSRRLLDGLAHGKDVTALVLEDNYGNIFEEVERVGKDKKVAFLVSGDPLFYSFGESAIKKFGRENCEVIPGVSSFQYAFCLLKESWKDYRIYSLHGAKDADIEGIFEGNKRFILLLDMEHNLKYIKARVLPEVGGRFIFRVASNLSMPGEDISEISYDGFGSFPEESLSLLIARRDDG